MSLNKFFMCVKQDLMCSFLSFSSTTKTPNMAFLRRYGKISVNLIRVNYFKIEKTKISFFFSQGLPFSGSYFYQSDDGPLSLDIEFSSEEEALDEYNKIEKIINRFYAFDSSER
jgi:hypothetical protein